MLAVLSLLIGASALVPLLCSRTSATPVTSLPELRGDEHWLQPRGPPCSQDLPCGHGPNSSSPPLVYRRPGPARHLDLLPPFLLTNGPAVGQTALVVQHADQDQPSRADSAAVFLAYPPYGAAAVVASTTPVTGYLLVTANQTAIAQKATVSMMNWINMASYDVQGCANQCTNTLGCKSFDLCESCFACCCSR